jgi:hypothetical protein
VNGRVQQLYGLCHILLKAHWLRVHLGLWGMMAARERAREDDQWLFARTPSVLGSATIHWTIRCGGSGRILGDDRVKISMRRFCWPAACALRTSHDHTSAWPPATTLLNIHHGELLA